MARFLVENVATPLFRFVVVNSVAPSKNVTGPVAATGETAAVKVTVWPLFAGFRLEAIVRAVTDLTVCGKVLEEPPFVLPSPL